LTGSGPWAEDTIRQEKPAMSVSLPIVAKTMPGYKVAGELSRLHTEIIQFRMLIWISPIGPVL